jgi:hypothetical protein
MDNCKCHFVRERKIGVRVFCDNAIPLIRLFFPALVACCIMSHDFRLCPSLDRRARPQAARSSNGVAVTIISRMVSPFTATARRTRKVVDTNCLQSDALRAYLSTSAHNYVVLTDYAAMEAYKGDTLPWIYDRMEILAQYPRQVLVLRGTQDICGLNGRAAASQEPLIDETQTHEFSEYCHDLLAAKRGDLSLQRQLLEHGRQATAHIGRMLKDMTSLSSGIDLMAKTYSPAELKILRRREKHTPQMRERLVQNVLLLAAQFFKEHPSVTDWPTRPEVRNMFIFRYALCAYVSILKRIEDGGAGKTKPEKLRNDVIDVNFATLATYFDGLLTTDKRAGEIYAEAQFLLREVFAMPPWWLRVLLSIGGLSTSLAK